MFGCKLVAETEVTMDETRLVELMDPFLREQGFVRLGFSWFMQQEDSILKIDVQPARYAPGPYVNLSVSYRRYGSATELTDLKVQVTTRLVSLVPDPPHLLDLTDLGNGFPEEERQEGLRYQILNFGLPWLDGLMKFEDARGFLARKTSESVFIAPEARVDLKP
jgi:hypothetical protein